MSAGAARRDDSSCVVPVSRVPAASTAAVEAGAGGRAASGSSRVTSPALEDPLVGLLERGAALLAADAAAVWLLDEAHLYLLAQRGLGEACRSALAGLARDAALPWSRVIRDGRIHVARPRRRTGARILDAVLSDDGIETACAARVVIPGARGETGAPREGLVVLGFRTPRLVGEEARDAVALLADQIGIVIENGRLAALVGRLEARLSAIEDLAIRLNRIQDVRGIAEAIVAEVGALTAFDTVRVYLVDDAAGTCEPVAFRGHFLGVANPPSEMLRVKVGLGLTGWVAQHGETIRVGNSNDDPRSLHVGPDLGPESLLVVPMSYEGRVRGVIVLSQRGKDRFSADDQTTLTVFAGHAAQAIVNAEYFGQVASQQAELQRQLASQRRLLEVSEQLLASFDSRVVLESIADSLAAVVSYDSLTIYRVDREQAVRRAVVSRDPYAEQILADQAPLDTGITGWVVARREALLVNDAHLDPRASVVPGTPVEPESVIVVPLISDGEVLGTLNLSRLGPVGYFSQNEFDLCKLFAGQASMALRTAEAHEAAQARAAQDPLTGLSHHGSFETDLRTIVAAGRPFALMMLDLDGFKAFNDTCGHPAGDALLRDAAAAMVASVRSSDHVYRYGGDEFAVLLPGATRATALEIKARIVATVAALGSGDQPPVSVSIGIATFPESGRTPKLLVAAADEQLYGEKRVRDRRALEVQLAALGDGSAPADARGRRDAVAVRLAAAIEQANDSILITDTDGRIQYVNPAFELTTGFARAQVLGQNPRLLKSGQQSAAFYRSMWGTIGEGRPWRGEIRNRRKDGSLITLEATITPLRDERGEIAGYVGAQRDVTRERASEALALRVARERALVADMLARLPAGEPPEVTAESVCLQVASLDGVDSAALYSFEADGRAVPLAFGRSAEPGAGHPLSLQRSRRLHDRAAEEGPWVEASDHRPAVRFAEQHELGGRAQAYVPITWDRQPLAVLVASSDHPDAVSRLTEELPVLAEIGTLAAALLGPALSGQAPLARMRAAIEAIIATRAFHPVFQPILDLRSYDVVGYEALTRFDDGVGPDVRFSEARDAGVGLELERATLAAAVTDARRLPAGRWLSINVSTALIRTGRLLAEIVVPVDRPLVVEVSEREAIEDYESFRTAVRAIAPDVLLAVDDAGAGFASLRHILELWPDFVKLDRSLVSGIDRDPARQALVAGMEHFAGATDCRLIAEGIETEGEAAALVELGVSLGQGFYLGRPAAL